MNSLMNKFIYNVNYLFGMGKGEGNRIIKFLTGALWFIIVTLCVSFMNTFKKRSDKVLAFIMLVVISAGVGGIFSIITIIISPIVNYVGFTLLQLVIAIIIVIKSNKKKKAINVLLLECKNKEILPLIDMWYINGQSESIVLCCRAEDFFISNIHYPASSAH